MLEKINKHFFPDQENTRQIFLYMSGEVGHDSVNPVIQAILEANLEKERDEADIKKLTSMKETDLEELADQLEEYQEPLGVINLMICSPGGDLTSALSLISVIEGSKIPVRTIAMGECGSAALMILMCGHQRVAIPYSSLLSHQYSTEFGGTYGNIKMTSKELDRYHDKIAELYREKTGLDMRVIRRKLLKDTDSWLSPEDALGFKIIDLISDLK